jgi:hypothetical protein
VPLGPVISRSGLTKNEVVRSEDAAEWTGPNSVHGPRLEVSEDGAGDVPAGLALSEVDVDALELEIVVAFVESLSVNSVLLGHHLLWKEEEVAISENEQWEHFSPV